MSGFEHSTVNYKDGLAITGSCRCAALSDDPRHRFRRHGDGLVPRWASSLATSGAEWLGLGETHYGGYSQMARVNGDWLIPCRRA